MKRPYCGNESRDQCERYYDRQQKGKGDFPVYVDRRLQREHGIGCVLSSLFRRVLPTLKAIAPHVLSAGVNMIEDVTSGKKWKDAPIKSPRGVETHQNSGQTRRDRNAVDCCQSIGEHVRKILDKTEGTDRFG
jgi:hypothetical protein